MAKAKAAKPAKAEAKAVKVKQAAVKAETKKKVRQRPLVMRAAVFGICPSALFLTRLLVARLAGGQERGDQFR